MNKRVYYKWLFIIASIHAWLLSVPTLILSYIEPPYAQETLFFYQSMFWSIILFALGYFIVGLDIEKNHGIVLMGIIGKLLIFISYAVFYIQGLIPIIYIIIGASDFIFAILYIEFLVNYKKL